MIILREKYFDDDSGSDFGKKALKVGAAVGAIGGAFYGARRGYFGNSLMVGSNKAWASAGNTLGNQRMVDSGLKGVKQGYTNHRLSDIKSGWKKDRGFNQRERYDAVRHGRTKVDEWASKNITGYKKQFTPPSNPKNAVVKNTTTTTPSQNTPPPQNNQKK